MFTRKILTAFCAAAAAAAMIGVAVTSGTAEASKPPCQVQVSVTQGGLAMPAQSLTVGKTLTLVGSVPAETFTVTSEVQTDNGAFVATTAPTFPISWDGTSQFFLVSGSCPSHLAHHRHNP